MSGKLALLTDLYELTMMQGYHKYNLNPEVVFDMFFRRQPFRGGFSVFAGLEDVVRGITELKFYKDDIEYLAGLKLFKDDFLHYLEDFKFNGDVYAMNEGSIVFPNEPLLRIHSSLIEAQLIESFVLNTINFQTLIATKAARVYLASREGVVLEFGLRRAHGINGALAASRAAFIGGAAATSNTLAGKIYDIPVKGTMAHSWVMAFCNEYEAFKKYGDTYPDSTVLLIDTYDSLGSGIDNAVKVGKRLKEKGEKLGVRLDSGDLEYISKQVRKKLDNAGLKDAKITVSNELDEMIINQLVNRGAPIDYWGVGTKLVTAGGDSSLTGVYKLVAKKTDRHFEPVIKLSDNPQKITNPAVKQVYRFYNGNNMFLADLLALEGERIKEGRRYKFYHPMYEYKYLTIKDYSSIEPLLSIKIKKGKIAYELPKLESIQENTKKNLKMLDDTYKRLINPHVYKVSLSEKLKQVKFNLIKKHLKEQPGK
ncbi:MAG: nicotinate phosphoribosyltransferase [Spirochaetales bacterium]|nr:nicotinate phosphoribosyltransferase [Spirochaetales bacterium]